MCTEERTGYAFVHVHTCREGGLVCMFAQSVSVPQAMSPCGES